MSPALRSRARRAGSVETVPDRRRRRDPRPIRRRDGDAAAGAAATAHEGAEVTLESKLLAAWAALAAGYPIECPVCGGPYTAVGGCSRCGSRLG